MGEAVSAEEMEGMFSHGHANTEYRMIVVTVLFLRSNLFKFAVNKSNATAMCCLPLEGNMP